MYYAKIQYLGYFLYNTAIVNDLSLGTING